jgi:hypothetical protein
MSEYFPDWQDLYCPEDSLGVGNEDGACEWLASQLEDYAYSHEGVTYDLCIEATLMLLDWLQRGQKATSRKVST